MNTVALFEKALGIEEPWYVTGVAFNAEAKRLDIQIDFRVGSKFTVPLSVWNVASGVSPDIRELNRR